MGPSSLSSSSNKPPISNIGIGSGFDAEAIIQKLVAVDQQPINNIKQQNDGLQTKISVYGQLQSSVSAMQTAAQKLSNPASWTASSSASSDSTVATVSAPNAGNTSHQLTVSQLAAGQSVASGVLASGTGPLGSGTLTIQLGQWSSDGSSFTAKDGKGPVSVTIGANDTLQTVVNKINGSSSGVIASIITDASGTRLAVRSQNTGETNGFKIDTGDAALSSLAFDPPAGTNGSGGLSLKQSASNAKFNLDGLDLTAESNTLTSVADGMTITLLKTSSTPINISSSVDTTQIQKNITDFVTAYNALMNMLHDDTKYDPSAKQGGPLQGDSKALSIQDSLRSLSSGATSMGGAFKRLADIGLDPGSNGVLTVNSGKLQKALGSLSDLQSFFTGADAKNSSNSGFATQWNGFATKALGSDGAITMATNGLNKEVSSNNDQISQLQDQSSQMEQRLRAQYTALDAKMGQLTGLQQYVNQQFGGGSASKASSG